MSSRKVALLLDRRDNVAIALHDIAPKTSVKMMRGSKYFEMFVTEAIPFAHKFATTNIEKGYPIYKYGEVIGKATKPIRAGQHVHIQNVESIRGKVDHQKQKLGRPWVFQAIEGQMDRLELGITYSSFRQ